MNVPKEIADAIAPLMNVLPPDQAMAALVVHDAPSRDFIQAVETVMRAPVIAANPSLHAALWLYVDDLDRSHTISQGIETATGSFWHGIMHRREGDFGNSHYWFNRTGHHPAMDAITGYDAHGFIDEVAARHKTSPPDLIARQRDEWRALFAWCANHA